ncbi:unnamed protein product [Effrenium voratum]|uniref:Uncharacterized protein n=1 Tax=Effrenium voratum TaxID=2562239 RepID=A0AA36IM66_9DINO|nr:unnamed protein product [Effrenium voratum]CAJ1424653.1 unnamed protein product [Effrenium voratum]
MEVTGALTLTRSAPAPVLVPARQAHGSSSGVTQWRAAAAGVLGLAVAQARRRPRCARAAQSDDLRAFLLGEPAKAPTPEKPKAAPKAAPKPAAKPKAAEKPKAAAEPAAKPAAKPKEAAKPAKPAAKAKAKAKAKSGKAEAKAHVKSALTDESPEKSGRQRADKQG